MVRAKTLSILFASAVLAGCSVDNAGYVLPAATPDLAGTRAFIEILPRADVEAKAAVRGHVLRRGGTVNGLATWFGDHPNRACFITLAADAGGLAALEHELWHCKAGAWHD